MELKQYNDGKIICKCIINNNRNILKMFLQFILISEGVVIASVITEEIHL